MQLRNTRKKFGILTKFFHWTTAAAFIGAYIAVYHYLWFLDKTLPENWPVLNVHWALGILVGTLTLPRLIWRVLNVQPDVEAGSPLEHALAHAAHWSLYVLMIVMPVTGYLGTAGPTDFGLFMIPSFAETDVFRAFSNGLGVSWDEFERPLDVAHRFVGKWIAWVVVAAHVAAALFHHFVRRDLVLVRMLP